MRRTRLSWLSILFAVTIWGICLFPARGLSPQGVYDAHDPSRIQFSNGLYWYFSTGDKIRSHFSTDLMNWSVGPSPMPNGVPAWAKSAVPANGGNVVWAPDVIWNPNTNLWTMFYSYSSWGSQTSVIGALTSPDLGLTSAWTDTGLVIGSDGSKNYNTIDPAPIFDASGNLWLSFGSYWTGIKIVPLSKITLKPTGAVTAIAGSNSGTDMEASFIWYHNGFYFLFFTHGQCCQGLTSTYQIYMGRSASITGPYLDKTGKSVLAGGGTLFQRNNGYRIGPGHVGINNLDGIDRLSYHYYDKGADGAPKLGLQTVLTDSAGWPLLGENFLNGTFRIVNKFNGLSLGVQGASLAESAPVDQWSYSGSDFQKWVITAQTDGTHTIRSLGGNKLMHLVGGYGDPTTPLTVHSISANNSERWIIDQTNDGYYRIRSVAGTVLDVPNWSANNGVTMWTYTWLNADNQKWSFVAP